MLERDYRCSKGMTLHLYWYWCLRSHSFREDVEGLLSLLFKLYTEWLQRWSSVLIPLHFLNSFD